MSFRVLAAACLAAVAALSLSCGKEGRQQGDPGRRVRLAHRRHRDLRHLDPQRHHSSRSTRSTPRAACSARRSSCSSRTTRRKPEEAGTAVTKLINQDHVVAILGEVASSNSLAAAPICQANKIPMISPSSTNPKVTAGRRLHLPRLLHRPVPGRGDGEVRARQPEGEERGDPRRHQERLLASASQTSSGEAFKQLGGKIVAEQTLQRRATATSARSSPPSRPRTPRRSSSRATTPRSATIARQARELGHQGAAARRRRLGLAEAAARSAATRSNGCFFSNHYSTDDPSPASRSSCSDYKAKLRRSVPDALAALGYDAAQCSPTR